MRRFILATLAVSAGLGIGVPQAAAQSAEEAWTYCNNPQNAFETEVQISGCTAIIDNNWADRANIAIALYNRGNGYSFELDYARAISDYDQAVQLGLHHGDLYYNRGKAYFALSDYPRAAADYGRTIQLNPQDAEAFAARGDVYFVQDDYANAVTDYNEAVRLNVQTSRIFYPRGLAHRALGDEARARADFDRNIAIYDEAIGESQNPSDLNSRCWQRAIVGQDLAEARSHCDRAIALAAGTEMQPAYYDSRGLVGLHQKRWQDAWNDYDAAVRGSSGVAHELFGRGIAALRLGRTGEGQSDIKAALQIDANIASTYADYGISP